jgi:hypothetical protein
MKIQVTEKDIANAKVARRHKSNLACYNCPIAQACERVYGKNFNGVARSHIFLYDNILPLPPEAIDFIIAFDNHNEKGVEPFVFEVKDK